MQRLLEKSLGNEKGVVTGNIVHLARVEKDQHKTQPSEAVLESKDSKELRRMLKTGQYVLLI